jgi:hypothetical protein
MYLIIFRRNDGEGQPKWLQAGSFKEACEKAHNLLDHSPLNPPEYPKKELADYPHLRSATLAEYNREYRKAEKRWWGQFSKIIQIQETI